MNEYKLTYGRVVILTTTILAKNLEEAKRQAAELEANGFLGLEPDSDGGWLPKPGSDVEDVQDYEYLWEIRLR